MARWEYALVRYKLLVPDDDVKAEEKHLNAMGQQGWRLAHILRVTTNAKFAERHYYFERPVRDFLKP